MDIKQKLLTIISKNPELSQREISDILGVSLGKVNYCIQALVEKGIIKVKNFKNSKNKQAYVYYLTPKGIEHKAMITVEFLKIKMKEYEIIKREIEELENEVSFIEMEELNKKNEFQITR